MYYGQYCLGSFSLNATMEELPIPPANSKCRVVLCGSLSFYGHIIQVRNLLRNNGIIAIPPHPPFDNSNPTEVNVAESRRAEAFAHLRRIKYPLTRAILVVNPEKHGIKGYIGPSTFAEICVAFSHSKKIFVLYDFPSVFEQELSEWNATPFLGDLDTCVKEVVNIIRKYDNKQMQLEF